jgi:colanic acid biosynthesis protein WcaH
MNLNEAINILDAAIVDPNQGLPEEVFLFISRITPLVNVDLLVKNEEDQILLTWRDDGLHEPGWHIPGGIVRCKELLVDRIHAVAVTELGVEVTFNPTPLSVTEFIHPTRRIRAHFITFLYECTLTGPLAQSFHYQEGAPVPGAWAWHEQCPENLLNGQKCHQPFFKKKA